MVALPIKTDFLFTQESVVTQKTTKLLNAYSSQCNRLKAMASIGTTWVSLYMQIIECVLDEDQCVNLPTISAYKPHQFLEHAHLSKDVRPQCSTLTNDLNLLMEKWHYKIYHVYLLSDLVSTSLYKFCNGKDLTMVIHDEISLYKTNEIGNKHQSIESKTWYNGVRWTIIRVCLLMTLL